LIFIHQTDPKGNVASQQYDAHNNLKISSNALNQQTEFVYDSQQRLEKVIDALMHSSEIIGRGQVLQFACFFKIDIL